MDYRSRFQFSVSTGNPRLLFGTVLIFAFLFFSFAACRSEQPDLQIEPALEQAILAEDWAGVAELLDSVNAETVSPVDRLLKGHAALALNRNNESSCLFYSIVAADSVGMEENIKEWVSWTQRFATKHPKKAIAHYFEGDARSRSEQWDAALTAFDQALQFEPNHALTLIARGLVYAITERWNEALVDLSRAGSQGDNYAEAYASLGALWLMKKDGAKGAEEAFNKSLNISPDYATALYGRGSVRSVLGKWEEAEQDLEQVKEIMLSDVDVEAGCLAEIIANNTAHTLSLLQSRDEIMLAGLQSENPSTEINRRITTMARNGHTGVGSVDYRALVNIAQRNPEYAPEIQQKLDVAVRNSPNLAQNLRIAENRVHFQGRMQQAFGSFWKGVDVSTSTRVEGKMAQVSLAFERRTNWYKGNRGTAQDIINSGQRLANTVNQIRPQAINPSGFKTEPEEATWDEGDWPFAAVNGLLYKPHAEVTASSQ